MTVHSDAGLGQGGWEWGGRLVGVTDTTYHGEPLFCSREEKVKKISEINLTLSSSVPFRVLLAQTHTGLINASSHNGWRRTKVPL